MRQLLSSSLFCWICLVRVSGKVYSLVVNIRIKNCLCPVQACLWYNWKKAIFTVKYMIKSDELSVYAAKDSDKNVSPDSIS